LKTAPEKSTSRFGPIVEKGNAGGKPITRGVTTFGGGGRKDQTHMVLRFIYWLGKKGDFAADLVEEKEKFLREIQRTEAGLDRPNHGGEE